VVVIPRFYPILDTALVERRGLDPVETAAAILGAGASILQYRCKSFFSRERYLELERIARLCEQSRAVLVVNDRADLAKIFAAGLHLGQNDLLPSDARRVTGESIIIGFSTHNEQQMRDAASQPADYLAFGPIFATSSKENPDPVVGLDGLRCRRALTDRPLVAIGGITRSNARSVLDAGADSVAVIGDVYPVNSDVSVRAKEWLRVIG
jgi:thiamine-phosphate pyrophosphorylase